MNWYKSSATIKELKNIGVTIICNNAILYRGTNVPNLTLKDLRYNDYLSSVPHGNDMAGNGGASSYGKYVVKYEIPISDIKVTNGELQYIGNSHSISTKGKYPLSIYKAYNDVYGSNYTSKEIDNMEYSHIRGVASMGLSGGRDEFDRRVGKKNELV